MTLALVAFALAVYILSDPLRDNLYNHFVWQADAFLHGRAAIPWPVTEGRFTNSHFRDIQPLPEMPGFGLMPYPPLAAIVLLPFVAVSGLAADAALLAAVIGALNVGLCWRLARRLTADTAIALLATLFYGFGTVAWYAAAIGSTWFLAHVLASSWLFLGITAAIDADRAQAAMADGRPGRLLLRQAAAGLVFGLGALARLTTILGAPFFALVGGGRSWLWRGLAAGIGVLIPVAFLLGYNTLTAGAPFHPAYEYSYRTERPARPGLVHRDWAIEDPRYVPQNLVIMLGWLPVVRPECGLALFDRRCPTIAPDPLGMSLLLSSPGYLLAAGLLLRRRTGTSEALAPADATSVADDPRPDVETEAEADLQRRLVAGSSLAVVAIALVNLAHFSQGWVQFGYRFSNDFAPFLLVLVVLGLARIGVRPLSVGLVALSVAINAWGVTWGVLLRW